MTCDARRRRRGRTRRCTRSPHFWKRTPSSGSRWSRTASWSASSAARTSIQAVASARKGLEVPLSDSAVRDKLLERLKEQAWAHASLVNVTVTDGVVDLWGSPDSDAERKAIRVAAEAAQGVSAVNDNLVSFRVHGWS